MRAFEPAVFKGISFFPTSLLTSFHFKRVATICFCCSSGNCSTILNTLSRALEEEGPLQECEMPLPISWKQLL